MTASMAPKRLVAAGGHVLAQDEATSVVWGMPGQVAHAGLCSAVLPLPRSRRASPACSRETFAVTPQDFDYLRKLLRERSGLVLSAEKQYLAESRLLPVRAQARLATLGELVG